MANANKISPEKRDEIIIWKSLLAAGTVTLVFYVFVLWYTA